MGLDFKNIWCGLLNKLYHKTWIPSCHYACNNVKPTGFIFPRKYYWQEFDLFRRFHKLHVKCDVIYICTLCSSFKTSSQHLQCISLTLQQRTTFHICINRMKKWKKTQAFEINFISQKNRYGLWQVNFTWVHILFGNQHI